MTRARTAVYLLLGAVTIAGCKGSDSGDTDKPADTLRASRMQANEPAPAMEEAEDPMDMAKEIADDEFGGEGRAGGMGNSAAPAARSGKSNKKKDSAPAKPGASESAQPTRSWFPETFLFEPLVITDDQGHAEVSVRVPDRLTTWRVLALAHSRSGEQAGTVARFAGTLPTYVDPVVPPVLRVGDQVQLPVQLVNTTEAAISGKLTIKATGATVTGGEGQITLPAGGSAMRYATVRTTRAGQLQLLASFGDTDAVVRTSDVQPTGRPVTVTRSGTLAAPRKFALTGKGKAPSNSDRVRLQVFPGALAILRSELGASVHRGGVANDAFAMLLAGEAPELLRALGDAPDDDALRTLTLLTTQRVVRYARTFDVPTATLLAEAARVHPDRPVLASIGQRAEQYLQDNQLPDGTCGGQTGWTLQRLLVTTADCARAAASRRSLVARASGAFERHADRIDDPYTAAAVLASGAVSGPLEQRLRTLVRDAIVEREDGARALAVPPDVVRADGLAPTELEATALAVLALADDPDAPMADLGATLLGGYAPHWGWGDGRANLLCIKAVLQLFKDPVPANTKIVLRMDGKVVASGELTRERIREVLTLEVNELDASGEHNWEIEAQPAVPGLGYSFALTRWVPWSAPSPTAGIELEVELPNRLTVGQPAALLVRVVAPGGSPIRIRLAPPAGVQPDTAQLDELVAAGTLSGYELADGLIELRAPSQPPAQLLSFSVRVIPTLAGTLHSGASTITVQRTTIHHPPVPWLIRPR